MRVCNFENLSRMLLFALALLLSAPFTVLLFSWGEVDQKLWSHLLETFLLDTVLNTLLVMLGCTLLATAIGTAMGVLCTCYEFPGVAWFRMLLVAPIGLPKVLLGFCYLSFLETPGFLISNGPWDFEHFVVSAPRLTLILLLSLSLYPYVFLAVVAGLKQQSADQLEVAQSMGASPVWQLWSITRPHLTPYIIGAAMLVALEVYGDFATSSLFGVDTITTSIVRLWSDYFSLSTAAQLSGVAMLVPCCYMLSRHDGAKSNRSRRSFGRCLPLGWEPMLAALPRVFASDCFF